MANITRARENKSRRKREREKIEMNTHTLQKLAAN